MDKKRCNMALKGILGGIVSIGMVVSLNIMGISGAWAGGEKKPSVHHQNSHANNVENPFLKALQQAKKKKVNRLHYREANATRPKKVVTNPFLELIRRRAMEKQRILNEGQNGQNGYQKKDINRQKGQKANPDVNK